MDVQSLVNGQCSAGFQMFYCEEGRNNCGATAGGGSTDGFDYCQNNFACPCSMVATPCCYCSCCVKVQAELPLLGNGYCRVTSPETGVVEKHADWKTYKKCIDLESCKHECREGCAGIAWTNMPADVNYDDCYSQGKDRCVVYLGAEPATTWKQDMASTQQDYVCYQGPGGEALDTIG